MDILKLKDLSLVFCINKCKNCKFNANEKIISSNIYFNIRKVDVLCKRKNIVVFPQRDADIALNRIVNIYLCK